MSSLSLQGEMKLALDDCLPCAKHLISRESSHPSVKLMSFHLQRRVIVILQASLSSSFFVVDLNIFLIDFR